MLRQSGLQKNYWIHLWLAIAAGLLATAQQVMMVLLPVMAQQFELSYQTLVSIQAGGSFLFLFSTPVWARIATKTCIAVILPIAMCGFALSFVLLIGLWWLHHRQPLSACLLTAGFVGVRLVYGVFASAIVPNIQNWSLRINQCAPVAALARINLGATLCRSITPLVAAALLPFSPLAVAILPLCLALMCLWRLPFTQADAGVALTKQRTCFSWRANSALILALATSASLSFAQFSIAPVVQQRLRLSVVESAEFLGYAVSLAAVLATFGQIYFSRSVRVKAENVGLVALLLAIAGAVAMQLSTQYFLSLMAICALSLGCNWLTLAYTAHLVNTGKGNGTSWVAIAHTLGYAVGALMLNVVNEYHYFFIALALLLAVVVLAACKLLPNNRRA